jgi:ferredoxin-type protein NapG
LCDEKASITILPRELVLGKAGDHYVKGWDKKDEANCKHATAERQQPQNK